jgi:hypothetical protein
MDISPKRWQVLIQKNREYQGKSHGYFPQTLESFIQKKEENTKVNRMAISPKRWQVLLQKNTENTKVNHMAIPPNAGKCLYKKT